MLIYLSIVNVIAFILCFIDKQLAIKHKRRISEKTLLFFDEVQVSENFIVSLKYFNESEKPYKIVCAGSLLRSKDK